MGSFYGAGFTGPGGGGAGGGIPARTGIIPEKAINLYDLDSGPYLLSWWVKNTETSQPYELPMKTLVSVTTNGQGEKNITYELVQDGEIFMCAITYRDGGVVSQTKTPIPSPGNYDPIWKVVE